MHVHPQGGEKKMGRGLKLQEKVVSAPQAKRSPPWQSKIPIFGGNWGDLDGGSG